MANTIIPEKIKSSSTFANVDAKYGPYEASGGQTALQVADAQLSGGVVDLRTAGLTVGIKQSDGSIKEYWYQPDGQGGLQLVEKQVAAQEETDPTVPAWAKAETKPSYTASEVSAIPDGDKGVANGVATLDGNGKLSSSQLPLGETSSTAFAGDKGKAIEDKIPSGASSSNKLATASDISGKVDKSEMSVTDGTGANADKTTIQLKNGTSATVLKQHQSLSGYMQRSGNYTENNFASFDSNGDLQDSNCNEGSFIKGVQQNGVDLQKDSNGKVNVTVQDGKSALQIYNETYGTNLDEAQFINVLKQNYPMEYVAYDATAAAQTIGTGFASIGTLAADSTTAGKLYLMPNDGTTPTGTILFVTVQTPNSNPAIYQWYSFGALSVPSNVLTQNNIVNDLNTGGVANVLSAEAGKKLGDEIFDETLSIITQSSEQDESAIDVSDGNIIPATGLIYTYTNIDPNKTYLASGRQGVNTGLCAIAYYSQNGTSYIGYEKRGGDGVEASTNFVDFRLTIPPTTDTIKVFGNPSYQVPELKLIVITSKIDEITQSVDELEQTVSDIESELTIEEEVVADIVYNQKQLQISNGVLISSLNKNEIVAEYSVLNNEDVKYFASGRHPSSNASNLCAIAYYSQDGTYIGYELQGSGSSPDSFVDYELTMPSGTTVVRIYGNVLTQVPALRSVIENSVNYLNDRIINVQPHQLRGKKIAVIGDSISTIQDFNTPYWLIKDIDVGQTIQSYVTWEDVYGNSRDRNTPTGKTIGGVLLTEAMIDGELHSFTPILEDVGKEIGVPHWYRNNTTSVKNWSQVLCKAAGATLLANASSSGSAITSMEAKSRTETTNGLDFICQQAWHPYTIGRCHVRNDAGAYVNPDVIFIYRGTNDFSYINNGCTLSIEDIDILTNGFDWTTDEYETKKFNFVAGYYLTIKALREAYPKAVIVCCTLNVFKRVVYDKWPTRNGYFTLPNLNDCIRKIANITGCGLVEFDKDGITFENCYSEGYITDSSSIPTHPNAKGHFAMGNKAYLDTMKLAIL